MQYVDFILTFYSDIKSNQKQILISTIYKKAQNAK